MDDYDQLIAILARLEKMQSDQQDTMQQTAILIAHVKTLIEEYSKGN